MTIWQRARRPEQKAERRSSILRAAMRLFEEGGFERASMQAIACKAGLSKANLYRYFRTKEELFISLYAADMERWTTSLLLALEQRPPEPGVSWLVAQIARSIEQHPRMASMSPLLATVMERNLPARVLMEFKREILAKVRSLSRAMSGALPGLTEEQATAFLHLLHALVAGLWPLAHPAADLQAIFDREEFAQHRPDFRRDMERGLRALLSGILQEGAA